MKRKDLKPGNIFRFFDDTTWACAFEGTHPYQITAPAERWSNTSTSGRLDDSVILWVEPEQTVTKLTHYTTGGIEAIDAIEAWGLNFRLANVVKYIARCGKKPGVEAVDDLRKARAYLSREIASLEGRRAWE